MPLSALDQLDDAELLLEEGSLVQVDSVHLPAGTYAKFQPQSPDFLSIPHIKAVLEKALCNLSCLTTGDVIAIHYHGKSYELRVLETKPAQAVCIIDSDIHVDFVAPVGYKEPEGDAQHGRTRDVEAGHRGYGSGAGFRAFSGPGYRLDGKQEGVEPSPSPGHIQRGIPNRDFKVGRITFIRDSGPPPKRVRKDEAGSQFVPFLEKGILCPKSEGNAKL